MIQAGHDGSANTRTVDDLWGKYVSYHNTQRPEPTSKKKSNSSCYHVIREYVAMEESLTGHVSSVDNPEEICTKVVPGGEKRKHLIGKVLHDLYKQ